MCVVVSLDIRNASHFIEWNHVFEALDGWDVSPYMRKLFEFYFQERRAEICHSEPNNGAKLTVVVTCDISQGSVVGPLLWNLTYDQVLRAPLPVDARKICFSDDTLMIASAITKNTTEDIINQSRQIVVSKVEELDLELAVENTETVIFRRKYKEPVPQIIIGVTSVNVGWSITYLGMIVDDNLMFKDHIKNAAQKANKVLLFVSRLMPNIGGPKEPRRRLLVSVVHSVILYGAPA